MPDPTPSIPDALARLNQPDQLTRLQIAQRVLERWPPDAATRLVETGLDSQHPRVRAESARLAGQLAMRRRLPGLARCGARLEELARDVGQPGRVRKSAVWSLGWIGAPESLAAIEALSQHDNAMYRRAAVEAAGRLGGVEAAAVLLRGLTDPAWQVRMDAAIGLGGLPGEVAAASYETLVAALRDEPHPKAAEQMLRSLPEVAPAASRSDEAIGVLLARLDDHGEARVSRAAARGLGELADAVTNPEALLAELQRRERAASAQVAAALRWSLMALRTRE